jgi:hypothetical protein
MELGFKSNSTLAFYAKNRQSSNCTTESKQGINLNRNFPFQWADAPSDGCAEQFPGTAAKSASEVSALLTLISKLNLKAWVHFDGKDATYMTPYAFTDDRAAYRSKDLEKFYKDDLESTSPNGFDYGSTSQLTGSKTTGTLLDYAASLNSTALQIGSSQSSSSKAKIDSEVRLHDEAVAMLYDSASFSFL